MGKIKKDVFKLIIAAVGLIILVAATVIVLYFQKLDNDGKAELDAKEQEEAEAEAAALMLTSFTAEDITNVYVENAYGNYEIITMAVGSEYTIRDMDGVPLDNGILKTAVGYLGELSANKIVEKNASDLGKYGLSDSGSAFVEIKTENGSEFIIVGDAAPSGNETYIRKKDENDVYVAYTYNISRLSKSKCAFAATTLTEAVEDVSDPPVVSTLIISKSGEEPVIINEVPVTPDGQPLKGVHRHEFEQPVGVGIDVVKGEGLVYGLYGLTASEAVIYLPQEEELEFTGLNEPFFTVEMQGDNDWVLSIGLPVYEDTENSDGTTTRKLTGYYGIFSDIPNAVYIFPESSLPWLSINYTEIMTRLFLLPGIFIISDVYVEAGENSLHLESDGDEQGAEFKVDGKVYVNQNNFKYFYQYLISASAESIYDGEELGKLAASFTYKYRDETLSDDIVEFYETANRKYIIVLNGEPLYKIKDNYITRLKQNIEALQKGEEIIISW